MTEEQRMEEGRRMFQIFAARMFEQRVLQAYREKVARERQAKLMEEEEEELRKEEARREKKAKEAQKKKEKAAQKKQALAEEKARKEAEKAAEEEARRQEEAQKAEETKRKAEEKRKKKEAQRKAEDEERARKEAERQRQKQMQVEQERKAKEAKEREKKAREDARLKEKESRERKEREVRELKEKQDAERHKLDNKLSKAETKPNQKQELEERAAKKAAALAATAAPVTMTLPKRPAQHATNPALPVLPQHPSATATASPKPSVATPVLPKAPTPIRPRQASQQGVAPGIATTSGSASQNPSPNSNTPARISPGPSGPHSNRGSIASQQSLNLSQAMSPAQSNSARFPSSAQTVPLNIPPGMPFPPGLHPAPPGFGNPLFSPGAPGFRPPPPGMLPSALTSPMLGRGFPAPAPPPGFGQPVLEQVPPFNPTSKDATSNTHSRQASGGGYDSPSMHAAQPISRPTPIGRPSSVVQGQRPSSGSPSRAAPKDSDDAQDHLGSSALLDDSEDVLPTLPDFQSGLRRGYVAPGRPGPAFPPPAPFADPAIASMWSSPVQPSVLSPFTQAPVAPPGFGGPGGWPASPSLGFSVPSGMVRPAPARPPASVAIRQILCNVCRDLAIKEPSKDGLISLSSVQEAMKTYVDINPMGDGPLTENDIVALCETEGTMANGGGNFDIHEGEGVSKNIRWNPDRNPQPLGAFGAPGHIGSPVMGSSFGR